MVALIEPWNEAGSKMTHAFCSAALPPPTDPSTNGEFDFNQQTIGEEAIKWPHVQNYFQCQRAAKCRSLVQSNTESLPLLIVKLRSQLSSFAELSTRAEGKKAAWVSLPKLSDTCSSRYCT
jgi:hypothetical protein